MMNNLFAPFDSFNHMPILPWNWLILMLCLIYSSMPIFMNKYKGFFVYKSIASFVYGEMSSILNINKMTKGSASSLKSLFMFILAANVLGLSPYNFTTTTNLTITFPLGVGFWLTTVVLGWKLNTWQNVAHLVPLGTPPYLSNFMVLIETISQFMRPNTLAIRLLANMAAGHLLLGMIGTYLLIPINPVFTVTLFGVLILFYALEIAVAFIQAFVFAILNTMYLSEMY